MPANAELIVALEAKLNKFEKDMRKAGQIADQAVEGIEQRFARSNPTISFADGLVKGALAGFSLDRIIRGFADANKEVASFGETSRRVGLDLAKFQEIRIAGQAKGIEGKTVDSGLDGLAKNLNEARQKENELTGLLEENNIKYKTRTGDVISTNQALEIAAALIANAATEQDKIKIAEAFGLPKDFIPLLEGGVEALRQAGEEARKSGNIIDADMVAKAKEFDAAWTAAWASFGTSAKVATVGALQNLAKAIEFAGSLGNLLDPKAVANPKPVRSSFDDSGISPFDEGARGRGFSRLRQRPTEENNSLVIDLKGGRTKTSSLFGGGKSGGGGGGGGGGKSDEEKRTEEIDRYIKTLERQSRVLEAEKATLGLSNAERAKAVELARIGTVTDEAQKATLDGVVAKNIELREAITKVKEAQDRARESTQFFGNIAVDSLSDLILNGAKAEDVFKNIAKSIANAALKAALLGQGPLAGLFGTAGTGGNVGGLFGSLGLGTLFGKAEGGPVRVGQAYTVGENGRETFVPNTPGTIVPAGSGRAGTNVFAPVINAPGADRATLQSVQRELADLNRNFSRRVAAANQTASLRGTRA